MSRRYNRRLLKFRTGQVAPSGRGKPFIPLSKTYFARCSTSMICSATTAGDVASFRVGEYNNPLSVSGNETFTYEGTVAETSQKHPTGHESVRTQGYDMAQVLSCKYVFTVSFKGGTDTTQDWVFAYKFTNDADVSDEIALTAGVLTVDLWHDLRMTRSWTWHRFSSVRSGGSIFNSSGIIPINVPSVAKISYEMNRDALNSDDVSKFPTRHQVLDGTALSVSDLPVFLTFMVFTTQGVALSAGDIQLEIDWFAHVKVARDVDDEAIIENLDHDT